jgi:hypothetical protein
MADKNKEAQELKGILGEVNAALKKWKTAIKGLKMALKLLKVLYLV